MSAFSNRDNAEFTEKAFKLATQITQTAEDKLSDVYQLERCIAWITQNNYRRTCLQFPEELLNDGVAVALRLESVFGWSFYILADTVFGSCCVDHISAEHVKSDSIIHFGHACLSPFNKLPVLYIFNDKDLNVKKLKNVVEREISSNAHITIFYSDNYHHLYNQLCDNFSDNKSVQVSKLAVSNCDSSDKDKCRHLFGRCFKENNSENAVALFLGDDCATLQNLSLALPGMKWYYYTPQNEVKEYELNRSKFLMKKLHQVELIKDASVLGILIGTLGIENYLDAIERVKKLAKSKGKKCYMLALGKPNVPKLANFPEIDVFVSIACIENVSRDFRDYYKPVVSLVEVEMALGNRSFQTEYINDFREVLQLSESSKTESLGDANDISLISGKIRCQIEFSDGKSMELQEKSSGAVVEAKGAEFLMNRSWRGLEPNGYKKEVFKAEIGRAGIPLGYRNEYDTLTKKGD